MRKVRHFHHSTRKCSTLSIAIIIVISVIILFVFGTGITVLLIGLNSKKHTCIKHEDCLTMNPCTEDKCDMEAKLCISNTIEGCCTEDKDCGASTCYNAFCDAKEFTCKLSPPLNGTICDDYNECTVDDRCVGYKCEGKRLTCNTGSMCSSGTCVKGSGCIFTAAFDGISCSDNNKCTVGDECWKGMCASGIQKDCSHYDSTCSRGVCDTNTGDCVSVPIHEQVACNDGLICTIQDRCINGKCKGDVDKCYDNNPCTVNKCVEGIGCMLRYEDFNKTCSTTCDCDDMCPYGFVCADGTCVEMSYTGAQIRFIDYEIEECSMGGHRLVLGFVLDSAPLSIGDDIRYIIPKSLDDITAASGQSLGFISEKRSLQSMVLGPDIVRSAFSLTTQCQIVTEENCETIFSMRSYKFNVKLHHCLSTSPLEPNCLDNNIVVSASVFFSVSDCTQFTQYQHIPIYGKAVLYAKGNKYTGMSEDGIIKGTQLITVGFETPVYNNKDIFAMTRQFRVCKSDVNHYLKDCVNGKDTNCLVTGCYNWDPNDSPILEYHDIVTDGLVSPLGINSWDLLSCYDDQKYNSPSSVKCSQNKCPNTPNGQDWVANMDDGFRFSTILFRSYTSIPSIWTFDIVFRLYMCNHTNALRSNNQEYHNIMSILMDGASG